MDNYAYNSLSEKVIGSAIEIHRQIGPGLLESAYRECLSREFVLRNIPFEREVPVPLVYKDIHLECGYRIDFLVDRRLALEIKSVESLVPIHEAQLLTYLGLGGWHLGLLINFNVKVLKDGIRRRVFKLPE